MTRTIEAGETMDLSVVVPVYNEEDNVGRLCEAISRALRGRGLRYEVLLVDDGSKDSTFERAKSLLAEYPEVRVVKLRRNCGQTPAMAAGIENARGDVVVTMDGDLQNDPEDIPTFLEKINEGYDLVVGWRHDRKDKLISRKIPSRIANWLIGKVTGVPIKDNGCSLKAFRAKVIKRVPLYSEMHRFIPAMASLAGPRLAEIKVRHHPRQFGKSKYGLSRTYKVLLDLLAVKTIIGFSARPLQWFVMPAIVTMLVSVLCLSLSFYDALAADRSVNTSLAGVGVLFGALAVFLVMTGFVAEIVYRTGEHRLEHVTVPAVAEAVSSADRVDQG
jgi:glycosyltransferase involved in cell wall biosynthesis